MRGGAGTTTRRHAANIGPVADVDRIPEMRFAMEYGTGNYHVGLVRREIRVVSDEDVARLGMREFSHQRLHGADQRTQMHADAARLDHHPSRTVEDRAGEVVALG